MTSAPRQYIAIDLKSFYASVECVERGLDPLDTCLVVADSSRTDKTICLAVSPALKSFGIGGRPRLFEVIQRVREVNRHRGCFCKSYLKSSLDSHPEMAVDYLVAPPRMAKYIEYSTRIYNTYLKYIAPEDIHVYSIDEVFIDATSYLSSYRLCAHDLAKLMIGDVLSSTGITATVGIGSNMYLCKVAMDIMAKKMRPDKDGVRIAELDEMSYRRDLWNHTPITDFWRVGRGIANKLARYEIMTMGDIARCSLDNEELLYQLFGINAELLIDHAWGWEPVTMDMVRAYCPESRSLSNGQVLQSPYSTKNARNVIREMADNISLKLTEQHLITDQIVLTVGYDAESLSNPAIRCKYTGRVKKDFYGRQVPIHAHGTVNIDPPTSSSEKIVNSVTSLYDRIINENLLVRRLTLAINHLRHKSYLENRGVANQLELFTDYEALRRKKAVEDTKISRERRRQEAMINIKQRFGKNAILKGLNYTEGATQRDRNMQIGGHHE